MKLLYKILIIIGVVFVLLLTIVFILYNGTLYYSNEKKHINIKEAEKIKNNESDSGFVVLDYFINNNTIYYYSKYNNWFSKRAYIYKADLNNDGLKRVCSLKTDKSVDFEYIYKNKMYYKNKSLKKADNIKHHDNVYKATINSIDLDSCDIKEIYSYEYKVFDSSYFKKGDNNTLRFTYNENGEIINSTRELIIDLDNDKIISNGKKNMGYNTIFGDDYDENKIYYDHELVYDSKDDITIDILSNNDDYLYYYTVYEDENYIYKLDLKNKVVVNKEKFPGEDIEAYDTDYFYIDKKLYKYNYDNDKLEVVINKVSDDVQFSELHVINDKYVFTFIMDGVSFEGDDQTYEDRIFIYDSNGKIVFKENQNIKTNTLRNAIIDNDKVYVVYSDGKVKTLDFSK